MDFDIADPQPKNGSNRAFRLLEISDLRYGLLQFKVGQKSWIFFDTFLKLFESFAVVQNCDCVWLFVGLHSTIVKVFIMPINHEALGWTGPLAADVDVDFFNHYPVDGSWRSLDLSVFLQVVKFETDLFRFLFLQNICVILPVYVKHHEVEAVDFIRF